MLPLGENPFYTGKRFNRGGIVYSVHVGETQFFGPWRDGFEAGQHDAITGPADEFDLQNPPGYAGAKPGEVFVKIGVGALRRLDENPYHFSGNYPLVDPGEWRVEMTADSARVVHRLQTDTGYGYELATETRLSKEDAGFTRSYSLTNLGTRHLDTVQYHHNFAVFQHVNNVGPDWEVDLAYAPEILEPPTWDQVSIEGDQLRITKKMEGNQSWGFGLSGTESPETNRFRITHRPNGQGIEVSGSEPIAKLQVWAKFRTLCVEPFVNISVAPGESRTWSVTYRFLDLPH